MNMHKFLSQRLINAHFNAFLTLVPYFIVSLVITNIFFLSFISLSPQLNINKEHLTLLNIFIYIATLIYFRKYLPNFVVSTKFKYLWLFIPYLLVILIRFPLYYPTYDDLAFHIMAGDYSTTLWNNKDFMAFDFSTYYYPALHRIYTPFLYLIGIRATLLLTSLLFSIWLFSLSLRFQSLVRDYYRKLILAALFIVFFFIPHLMATHLSFMTDFVSFLICLEVLYQFLLKKENYTFAALLVIVSALVKQSTAIFFLPIFLYYLIKNNKAINWKQLIIINLIFSLFFVRLYIETGNPLFNLYNSIFKSSLYPLVDSIKFPLWGPTNIRDYFIWPIIGQFTDRYGEGEIIIYAKLFFSFIPIVPYLASIYYGVFKRKPVFLVILFSYLIWSYMSGYSRYYIPLNAIALIILTMNITLQNKALKKYLKSRGSIILVVISILSFSSLITDFSWRPYPLSSKSFINSYYFQAYREGLTFIFKDTIPNLAKIYAPDFSNHDIIVPIFRGTSTFYAYLASLNGRPIISGVTLKQYQQIMEDEKISKNIKYNLFGINYHSRAMVIVDTNFKSFFNKDTYISKLLNCKKIYPASKAIYLQRDYYFNNVEKYSCTKKPIVQN